MEKPDQIIKGLSEVLPDNETAIMRGPESRWRCPLFWKIGPEKNQQVAGKIIGRYPGDGLKMSQPGFQEIFGEVRSGGARPPGTGPSPPPRCEGP